MSAKPPRPFWDELASGAGMLAFAIILTEFVLSGRFRTVSRKIGMDITMRFHQLLARTALVLAVLHPFLYQSPFNRVQPWDTTRQFAITSDFTNLATGIAAWILLGAFVLLSIGRDRIHYTYETWRLAHGLGALLIAALLLHHTLEAGRYSQDPALAAVWIILFAIALFTLIWVYAIKPSSQRGEPWTVQSVERQGLKTWQVTLSPDGHKGLDYEAGQFAWLNTNDTPFTLNEHPFSISSAPASGPNLEFIIKELGDHTAKTGQIKPGTRAFVDGPHGHLVITDRNEPGIGLIAGGVGIAPLIGIMRQLKLEEDTCPQILLYGNRSAEQIACNTELEDFAQAENRDVIHVLSEPPEKWTGETGIMDADCIARVFNKPDMKQWVYVLCGPAPMMETAEDTLISLGVPANQILSERFQYD
ncbi:MAG: ferredoxin reductase family protein [Pseudomonadota bacterium]